jgi:hypothetical protein
MLNRFLGWQKKQDNTVEEKRQQTRSTQDRSFEDSLEQEQERKNEMFILNMIAAENLGKQEQDEKKAAQAAKVQNATEAAKRLMRGNNGNGIVIFREMYDLPLLTVADKASGPWQQRFLALDANQDGSYFIVENPKGEIRRAMPTLTF